jgi:7-carboxy-7-deazaguanine synthase
MENNNIINVSEFFLSIQGEGTTTGIPSIFIRLSGCNFACGLNQMFEKGLATWKCDSEKVWKTNSPMTYEELYASFESWGEISNIIEGRTHLIWTGGEPTMPQHVKSIVGFLDLFTDLHPEAVGQMYNEIETNGSIPVFQKGFYKPEEIDGIVVGPYIQQINCSAKLANSGMGKPMRINKRAIEQVLEHPEGYFKFVISSEPDILEIQEDFVKPFNIHWKKIILMPAVDNRDDLPAATKFLFDMCKKYGYRGVTRSHILAWDRVTGV